MNDLNRTQGRSLKKLIRSILEIDQQREEGVKMFRRFSRLPGMRRFVFGAGLFHRIAFGCRDQGPIPASTHEITVSAAISLKNAFEEIGKTFMQKHPGTKVIFNFGASGDLARQIEAGAPVDVFASAAQKDMDDIGKKDLIAANSRKDFAKNGVVLVKPANSIIPAPDLNGPSKEGDSRRSSLAILKPFLQAGMQKRH